MHYGSPPERKGTKMTVHSCLSGSASRHRFPRRRLSGFDYAFGTIWQQLSDHKYISTE